MATVAKDTNGVDDAVRGLLANKVEWVRYLEDKNVRLDEIARAVFEMPASALEITRVAIYGKTPEGEWAMPHEPQAIAMTQKGKNSKNKGRGRRR